MRGCKPHSGGFDGQLMEQSPTYRALFVAMDITLKIPMTFLAVAFLIIALPILGLQAIYYLKEGGLLPVSVVDGLQFLNIRWADDPNVLLGLHKVLAQIPLSPILLSLAALCYFSRRRTKKYGTTREL